MEWEVRKTLFIITIGAISLIVAAYLILAFCCRLPITPKDPSKYKFVDPLPLENYPDIRLSILTTATITAPEGGAFSEIPGGSFKSGFLAAGFSSAAADLGPEGFSWKGAAYSAAAGGAGSALGGGKFADGAVTGSFTYMLNAVSHDPNGGAAYFRSEVSKLRGRIENLLRLTDDYDSIIIGKRDWKVVLGDAYYRADAVSRSIGSLESRAINFDTIFFGFGDDYFTIKGVGEGYGRDINYIGVGILYASFGRSQAELGILIKGWNYNQQRKGYGTHNIDQIKPATKWGKIGYRSYNRDN